MNRQTLFNKWLRQPIVCCLLVGAVSATILASVQYAGILQGIELHVFDRLLLKRPRTDIDKRIVVIGETEADIRRFGHPLSDQVLTDAINVLEKAGARVIGVDKYRDVAAPPGTDALKTVLQQYGNVVWIFYAGNSAQDFIPPPAALADNLERIGFNDIIEDTDGVLRRGLLFLDIDDTSYYSFPLLLTLHYLAAEKIGAQSDAEGNLSLNGISLPRIGGHFGAYEQIDTGGYQIMLEYPGLPQSFRFFTLAELLDGKVDVAALRDKIVLIGGAAASLVDHKLLPNEIRRFGVEYHAYFTSQLLNIATGQKPPLRAWSELSEFLWLLLWCLIGAFTRLRKDNLRRLAVLVIIEVLLLPGVCYLLLCQGWWIPLMMPLSGWMSAFALSTLYFFRQERAERHQLMQLFSSHVSSEVATRLWEVREQFLSDGGVRTDTLTATVLFTDLSNFTLIAESVDPLVLMKWLNQYMKEMSLIVMAHGGMVNKYIGDAIMAVFGVPMKRETEDDIAGDAQQAVRCALQFNIRLRELNRQWQEQGLPTVTMRTGIYTGPLVAGSLGGATRMEYTVIGDTVNIASRLESFDKTIAAPDNDSPCRILIGETTFNYVRHLCNTKLIDKCRLKGKNQSLNVYQVLTTVKLEEFHS